MRLDQLAINSITTTNDTLDDTLEAYAAAGFRNVEFHLPLVKEALRGSSAGAIKRKLDERGLRSIGGFDDEPLTCFGRSAQRSANRALFRENAELVHALGGGTIVFGTDGPAKALEDPIAIIAEAVAEMAGSLDDLDVELALEFNWSPIVRSLDSAAAVVCAVDHPRVGVLFDPAHYYTTVTKLEHLTPANVALITHVHMNDMAPKPGDLSDCDADRVLPGQGVLDLRAIIDRLLAGGYAGCYSIELFNEALWALPAFEAAQLCHKSLVPLCAE